MSRCIRWTTFHYLTLFLFYFVVFLISHVVISIYELSLILLLLLFISILSESDIHILTIIFSFYQFMIPKQKRLTNSDISNLKIYWFDFESLQLDESMIILNLIDWCFEYITIPFETWIIRYIHDVFYCLNVYILIRLNPFILLLPIQNHFSWCLLPIHNLTKPYSETVNRHMITIFGKTECLIFLINEVSITDLKYHTDFTDSSLFADVVNNQ